MRSVLIVGAGALGAMYAAQIAAAGHQVTFVADRHRAARLRRTGVVVNGVRHTFPVLEQGRRPATDPFLVIVAVKHHHLPAVCLDLPTMVGPDTTVISVLNGIESELSLIETIGAERVLYALAAGMDAVRVGHEVTFSTPGRILFGRPTNDPAAPDARVQALKAFLDQVGIVNQVPADMLRELWGKFMLNIGINQWSAVLRQRYRLFQTDPRARNLMRRTMREVVAVAQAEGVALRDADIEFWLGIMDTLGPEGKTSMLQDIEAGRKTEVEAFAGRLLILAQRHGVPVPLNEALLDLIQLAEAQYGA